MEFMCFAVSSIFLFECVLIFSCWSLCWQKVSAHLTAAGRQVLHDTDSMGGQTRHPLGRQAPCVLGLWVYFPLQLGCLEHIMDNADFWNGSSVLWMWKHAVCFHTWKLFKERSEIFPFMRIHWTFFDWLQTIFFFYHIWWFLPMCAYRNWRHLHS